jgi:hypothetical protein
LAECAEDGVRIDAEHRSEVARWRQALPWFRLAFGDRAPDFSRHLLVEV